MVRALTEQNDLHEKLIYFELPEESYDQVNIEKEVDPTTLFILFDRLQYVIAHPPNSAMVGAQSVKDFLDTYEYLKELLESKDYVTAKVELVRISIILAIIYLNAEQYLFTAYDELPYLKDICDEIRRVEAQIV